MKRRHQPKELPEIRPCKCGDIGVTLRPRGGRWSVHCLSRDCDCAVRGFETELEAILAWNAKTMREGKEATK